MKDRHRMGAATAVVVLVVVIATILIEKANFRSPWNLLWIVGVPLAATVVFYRRSPMRYFAFLGLFVCSYVTLSLTGELLGGGP